MIVAAAVGLLVLGISAAFLFRGPHADLPPCPPPSPSTTYVTTSIPGASVHRLEVISSCVRSEPGLTLPDPLAWAGDVFSWYGELSYTAKLATTLAVACVAGVAVSSLRQLRKRSITT